MREELLKLKKMLLKQAEECQQRMLAAEKRDSWEYGYNHGAKDSVIMIVNSINEILDKYESACQEDFLCHKAIADKTMIEKAYEYAEARYDLDYCENVRDVLNYLKSLIEE